MMNLDFHHVCFPGTFTESTLRETLKKGFQAGWTTTIEGDTDVCAYTDLDAKQYLEWTDTETAINELTTNKNGHLVIFVDGSSFDFKFKVLQNWGEYGLPELEGVIVTWHRSLSRKHPEQTTNYLFEVSQIIQKSLDTPFAFSHLARNVDREKQVTESDVEVARIPDIYWMMLLSDSACERIDRDRLRTAPVWKSELLTDSGIGVVATGDPYHYTKEKKEQIRTHIERET